MASSRPIPDRSEPLTDLQGIGFAVTGALTEPLLPAHAPNTPEQNRAFHVKSEQEICNLDCERTWHTNKK